MNAPKLSLASLVSLLLTVSSPSAVAYTGAGSGILRAQLCSSPAELLRAARGGDVESMRILGKMLIEGNGVKRDVKNGDDKAKGILEKRLADAENEGLTWEAAAIRGQMAELDKQHAKNTEEYKREKQMFLSMFGSRKKVDKYDATVVILAALEKKLCHLQMVEAMIQHENSGFFNKWLKPWNWGVSTSSMDSKWEQSSVILRSQINQLNEALDEIRLIRREMEEDGFTRSRVLSIIKGK